MRKLIIIPTYNERENIEAMVAKVFSLAGDYSLLVVDDNSPDGTAAIVRGLMTNYPERLFMIEREGKLGLGTAYLAGFRWALVDVDHPEDLPTCLPTLWAHALHSDCP